MTTLTSLRKMTNVEELKKNKAFPRATELVVPTHWLERSSESTDSSSHTSARMIIWSSGSSIAIPAMQHFSCSVRSPQSLLPENFTPLLIFLTHWVGQWLSFPSHYDPWTKNSDFNAGKKHATLQRISQSRVKADAFDTIENDILNHQHENGSINPRESPSWVRCTCDHLLLLSNASTDFFNSLKFRTSVPTNTNMCYVHLSRLYSKKNRRAFVTQCIENKKKGRCHNYIVDERDAEERIHWKK